MGNTNATSSKRDRTYSVDSAYDRRESSSPRGDDSRTFEFVAGGRKKPVLCYQSSNEYSNEDSTDDYKVMSDHVCWRASLSNFRVVSELRLSAKAML